MKVRATKKDDNGQFTWVFGQGFTSYKKEQHAIKQDIENALYEWKNDCFFALNNGIDYKIRLGYKNQKEILDNDIVEVVKGRYGVYDVVNFESSIIDSRVYTCQFKVITMFSEDIDFGFSIQGV